MKILLISVISFILSIIWFFIKNGVQRLSIKQIVQLSGHKLGKLVVPDALSMFSAVLLVRYYDSLPAVVLFFLGLSVLVLQKIVILFLQKVIINWIDNVLNKK